MSEERRVSMMKAKDVIAMQGELRKIDPELNCQPIRNGSHKIKIVTINHKHRMLMMMYEANYRWRLELEYDYITKQELATFNQIIDVCWKYLPEETED